METKLAPATCGVLPKHTHRLTGAAPSDLKFKYFKAEIKIEND